MAPDAARHLARKIVVGQAGSDLPLPEESGLASSAKSDSKGSLLALSWGHDHPGHPPSGPGSTWHFPKGSFWPAVLSGKELLPSAEQPCRRGWRSSPETPSMTELPHNVYLMKKKATFQN